MNSLDTDQARQNVRPDLDPKSFKLIIFVREFFEKVDFEKKNQQTTKKGKFFPGSKELKLNSSISQFTVCDL